MAGPSPRLSILHHLAIVEILVVDIKLARVGCQRFGVRISDCHNLSPVTTTPPAAMHTSNPTACNNTDPEFLSQIELLFLTLIDENINKEKTRS